MPREINKATAQEAVLRTFQMVERDLSRQDYLEVCEELTCDFQARVDAANTEDKGGRTKDHD